MPVEESLWIESWFANAQETGLEEINGVLLQADFWTNCNHDAQVNFR